MLSGHLFPVTCSSVPALLIAKAFLWQNRWLLVAFGCWPVLLGAFTWSPHHGANPADVTEVVQQEMFYGSAVITFLAGSAIHNERRSRRIVTVLSKAIGRSQYLLGLLLGSLAFAAAYFVMVGIVSLSIGGWSISNVAGSASLLLNGIVAAFWLSSLALALSTFLHPLLAGFLAGGAGFAPLALSGTHLLLCPLTALIANVNPFSSEVSCTAVIAAGAESIVFFYLGAQIFVRRDLGAAVE